MATEVSSLKMGKLQLEISKAQANGNAADAEASNKKLNDMIESNGRMAESFYRQSQKIAEVFPLDNEDESPLRHLKRFITFARWRNLRM
jgi:hypothetical protein